jgi:hypothetical protein
MGDPQNIQDLTDMSVTYLDGHFPFCVPTEVIGYSVELWDGVTFYESPDGWMQPSNDENLVTPVVGDGTGYLGPFTLEQAAEIYWFVRRYEVEVTGGAVGVSYTDPDEETTTTKTITEEEGIPVVYDDPVPNDWLNFPCSRKGLYSIWGLEKALEGGSRITKSYSINTYTNAQMFRSFSAPNEYYVGFTVSVGIGAYFEFPEFYQESAGYSLLKPSSYEFSQLQAFYNGISPEFFTEATVPASLYFQSGGKFDFTMYGIKITAPLDDFGYVVKVAAPITRVDIRPTKYFTYGGIYDEDTGEPV